MTVSAVPPAVVADAAAAAKAWLRAADGQDEDTILALAATAIALAEAFCGQLLIGRAASETVAAGSCWQSLVHAPVTAIAGITVGDPPAALPADAYAIDIDAHGTGWVRLGAPIAAMRVTVSYTAGEAAGWADLPPPVAQGIGMLVAHLFDHRDGDQAPPAAVAALWRPWRRMALGSEQRR